LTPVTRFVSVADDDDGLAAKGFREAVFPGGCRSAGGSMAERENFLEPQSSLLALVDPNVIAFPYDRQLEENLRIPIRPIEVFAS